MSRFLTIPLVCTGQLYLLISIVLGMNTDFAQMTIFAY